MTKKQINRYKSIEDQMEEVRIAFPCIYSNCDQDGCIPYQISEDEWEAQQCEFCYTIRFPLLEQVEKSLNDCEQTTTKAFGGCTDCYGKGYFTVKDFTSGAEDFGGEGFITENDPIRYCHCERGTQIKSHFDRRDRIAREEERERIEVIIDTAYIFNDQYLSSGGSATHVRQGGQFIKDNIFQALTQPNNPN